MSLKDYYEKRCYIEGALNNAFQPLTDFEEIKYTANPYTGEEYVKIADKIGGCVFLNVTGKTKEEIMLDISSVVLWKYTDIGGYPKNIVIGTEERRRAAAFFAK